MLLFDAHTAAAQAGWDWSLELVPLAIRVDQPDVTVDVEALDEPGPGRAPRMLLHCERLCSDQLPRGRYKLTLRTLDPAASESMVVRLNQPMHFVTDPPNYAVRRGGLALAIGGGVVGVTGVVSLVVTLLGGILCGAGPSHGSSSCGGSIGLVYGGVAAPIGILVAVAGILMFTRNRRPFDRIELEEDPGAGRLAVLPTAEGIAGR